MAEKVKWGILGPGVIANKFVTALKTLPEADITAVASRNIKRAEDFGIKYSIPNRMGSYDEMLQSKLVDVIYISTPHYLHKEMVIKCIEAGKAVLCEKPIAVDYLQIQEIIKASENKQLFIMEAMWTRFLPIIKRIKDYVFSGAIGDIKMVKADFSFKADFNPENRLFNPELGGGALLDVGIYTIAFAQMIFKEMPVSIHGEALLGQTGVDEQAAIILKYGKGQLAQLSCAVSTEAPQDALIIGESGYIKIPHFWMGEYAEIFKNGVLIEKIHLPHETNGYEYEAMEVMKCIRGKKTESGDMTLQNSGEVVMIMDALRKQWRLKYPFEN